VTFLIAPVLDAVLSYTRKGCDHEGIRRCSALHTETNWLHVPQVLSLEDGSESGLFDGSCAQPVSWLTRTVELVVELVVNPDVSCCPPDHLKSDPCGTVERKPL